jgi:hypothetical protein
LATGGEKYWNSRSDYQHIQELTTPQDYLRQHRQDVRWLEKVLQADDFKGPRMVVTHHLPSLQLIEPRYQTPTPNRNGYYASGCEHLLPMCDGWLCGHTHSPIDQIVSGTRCISNPVGYPWENSPYRPQVVLKIPKRSLKIPK